MKLLRMIIFLVSYVGNDSTKYCRMFVFFYEILGANWFFIILFWQYFHRYWKANFNSLDIQVKNWLASVEQQLRGLVANNQSNKLV